MKKTSKKRAPAYISPNQLSLEGFQTPFELHLQPSNRWVVLARLIPWDEICSLYLKRVGLSSTGRPPLNPRLVIGSLIIKHLCNLDDRETVDQISENIYMQYFLGYTSFSSEQPFDASLFVEFRKRLGMDFINTINERILALRRPAVGDAGTGEDPASSLDGPIPDLEGDSNEKPNNGKVILDATACPQDIAYPTDLDLLSSSREKSEELIDLLYSQHLHRKKPRTYREIARKCYLKTAQKKSKSRKEIRKAVGKQLRFLGRNLRSINHLLDSYGEKIPLEPKQYKYFLVITTLYQQQKQMYETRTHSVDDRIVSIHQPHVRPIVRGKTHAKVEFGSKIHVSMVDGFSYLDELSWDAFNEGSHMMGYLEKYKRRFGFYPAQVLADQIYCTRANRHALKKLGIKLMAKPLGRPPAVPIHLSPGSAIQSKASSDRPKQGTG